MTSLYVIYDADCGFCSSCREWLSRQRQRIALTFLASTDPRVGRWFPGVERWVRADELVVVSSGGAVYRGSKAWIMCFYALTDYEAWSHRLAGPLLFPFAREAYRLVASSRYDLSALMGLVSDSELKTMVDSGGADPCDRCDELRPGEGSGVRAVS